MLSQAEFISDELYERICRPDLDLHPRVKFHHGLPAAKVIQRKLLDLTRTKMSSASAAITNEKDATLLQRYFYRGGGSPKKLSRPMAVAFANIIDVPVGDLNDPHRLALIYAKRIGMISSQADAVKTARSENVKNHHEVPVFDMASGKVISKTYDVFFSGITRCRQSDAVRFVETSEAFHIFQLVPTCLVKSGDEFLVINASGSVFIIQATGDGEHNGSKIKEKSTWVSISKIVKNLRDTEKAA